ncbi:type IV secretion system protein [Ruegeria sp. Ofav3-42]|uniref:type IV secretion system protein n=1 Tax=Ruegeria sp. Ofav3-42 TaxID=2917759 RepID=UPI001EF4CBD9|nr:type IV secretion system protein [Ruegeria sp. Ofav3-42]MCG7521909.1 type IV secretion system protein [Ruegeria sp. Ofav3-42]
MNWNSLSLVVAVMVLGMSPKPATPQGVPTFDNSNLRQLVLQLEHMAEDLNVQLQQLATMRQEVETQLSQLLNLEAQLASLSEGNELGELFASAREFERVRGKLTAPLATVEALSSGDFLSGFRPDAELDAAVERVLSGSGFTQERLSVLATSEEPADNRLATRAGSSAMLSMAAQESHAEAGESLGRLETMVGLIDDQQGLKAAVDLNTRVTAELGIILTQIWRLEAAAGVNGGQLGLVDAATLAEERKFRSMEVPK